MTVKGTERQVNTYQKTNTYQKRRSKWKERNINIQLILNQDSSVLFFTPWYMNRCSLPNSSSISQAACRSAFHEDIRMGVKNTSFFYYKRKAVQENCQKAGSYKIICLIYFARINSFTDRSGLDSTLHIARSYCSKCLLKLLDSMLSIHAYDSSILSKNPFTFTKIIGVLISKILKESVSQI